MLREEFHCVSQKAALLRLKPSSAIGNGLSQDNEAVSLVVGRLVDPVPATVT